MTVIVGVVEGKNVWLGGDRAATGGNLDRTLLKNPKIFLKDGVGVGVCGLPKVMDAIRHGIEFPPHESGSAKDYLVSKWVPAIREGLKKFDCTEEHRGQHYFHGALLIAYRGELHKLEGNFQLVESARGYASVGSGSPAALGALKASKGVGPAKKRVLDSLKAAAEENAGCAPPFDTLVVVGLLAF